MRILCAALIFIILPQLSCTERRDDIKSSQSTSRDDVENFDYSGEFELHFSAMRNSYGTMPGNDTIFSLDYSALSERDVDDINDVLNRLSHKVPPHKICATVVGEFKLGDEGENWMGRLSDVADLHPC